MKGTNALIDMNNVAEPKNKNDKKKSYIIISILIICAVSIVALIIFLVFPSSQDRGQNNDTQDSTQDNKTSLVSDMVKTYNTIMEYQNKNNGSKTNDDINYLKDVIKTQIDTAKSIYGEDSDTYINANILLAKFYFANNQPSYAISLLRSLASRSSDIAKYYYYVELLDYYKDQKNIEKQEEYLKLIIDLPDNMSLFGSEWDEEKENYKKELEGLSV